MNEPMKLPITRVVPLERYSFGRVLIAGDAVCISISSFICAILLQRRHTECLRIKERVLAKRSRSAYNSEYVDVSNYNYSG